MDRKLNGSPQFGSDAAPEGWTPGHAALLLVEALMHALVEKGVISREEFVDTVDSAADVERDLANASAPSPSEPHLSLLYPLTATFRKELGT
jgi:hypothetical protein